MNNIIRERFLSAAFALRTPAKRPMPVKWRMTETPTAQFTVDDVAKLRIVKQNSPYCKGGGRTDF